MASLTIATAFRLTVRFQTFSGSELSPRSVSKQKPTAALTRALSTNLRIQRERTKCTRIATARIALAVLRIAQGPAVSWLS